MNKLPLYASLWLLLSALLLTCRPIPEYTPEPLPAYGAVFWGDVKATRNSVDFMNPRILGMTGLGSFNTPLCDPDLFYVGITEFDKGGCERTRLHFTALPRGTGVSEQFQKNRDPELCANRPFPPHVILYVTECDITLGEYLLVASKPNRVDITTYNEQTREVKGSFDLYFAVNRRPMPTAPDSLHCVGTFTTKLLPDGKLRYSD